MDAQSMMYCIGAPGGSAFFLVVMILKADLSSLKKCAWWFEDGCLIVGAVTSAGLFGEYIHRM